MGQPARPPPQSAKRKPARPNGIVRGLFTLIAVVVIGLGALAIVTEVHTGSVRGRGLVTFEGRAAVEMGVIMVVLGLMPLAIWARTPRQAQWWLVLCVLALAALLVRMLIGQR